MTRTHSLTLIGPASWALMLVSLSFCAANEPLMPEGALRWQPKQYEEATLYPRIQFLQPAREWERLDVWVPDSPAMGNLPCVVVVYGGGYGDKAGGFINDARPLLQRGFVVASPDYALQTDAPVPLCAWDVANAIRYLRAHAEKYRIDPERIGVWGWSAGGWIAQDLCYMGPERVVHAPSKNERNQKVSRWFPMREPRSQYAEQSVRVQAVVTDWGAGKLWNRGEQVGQPWLSPDDPPLFTCFNDAYSKEAMNPVTVLQSLGVPSSAVYGIQGSIHVPSLKTPATCEDGRRTTWGDAIYHFFEQELKTPRSATAPELLPHGGAIVDETEVQLLTVHPRGSLHYTLDGSKPTANSARYQRPIVVRPGQTLQAITICPGLRPSRVAVGEFVAGARQPRISTTERVLAARVGEPWKFQFQAENAAKSTWYVGGKTGAKYREFDGQRFNPPRTIPWLTMDPATGVLSGVPRSPGTYPVIVSCMAQAGEANRPLAAGDALLVVIEVAPAR